MKKKFKRALSVILSIAMVTGCSPVTALAEDYRDTLTQETDNTSEEISKVDQMPEETTDSASDQTLEESQTFIGSQSEEEEITAEEQSNPILSVDVLDQIDTLLDEASSEVVLYDDEAYNMPAFSESKTIDDVKIMVEAPEGVFPEGAVLDVQKVSSADQYNVDKAVDETRDENVNVAKSYTYDIKVLDQIGNEIQPQDGQNVNVSFTLNKVADQNLTTDVYHISEERGEFVAEELEIVEQGETVIAQTDGFSYYTVEFTYDEKQYVMSGDSTILMSDILEYVGLTGTVTSVSVSDESLFSATGENDEWMVTAHQAFSTDEWMKVTIDGLEYLIKVTDASVYTTSQTNLSWTRGDILYVNGSTYTFRQCDSRVSKDIGDWDGSSSNLCSASIDSSGKVTITASGSTYGEISLPGGYNAWRIGYHSGEFGDAGTYYFEPTNYNPPVTVSYNANAGSDNVSGLPDGNSQTVNMGSSVTLPTLSRSGYTFDGWYTETTNGSFVGNGGTSYTLNEDVTLYAYWSAVAATEPTISVTGANLTYGYTSGSISVNATPASGHTITGYQWYERVVTNGHSGGSRSLNRGDTLIENATNPSFAIPTGKNVGTYYYYCVVTTKRTDNDQTTTGTSEIVEVMINKATLTVTAKSKSITYGDNPVNDGVDYNGLKNNDDASSLEGTLSYSYNYTRYGNVGSYTITPSGLSSDNYNITFNTGTLTVNAKTVGLNWGISSFTYDGQSHVPVANASGLVNGDVINVTVSGAQTNAGIGYVATATGLTGAKASNYSLPSDTTTDFSIARQAIGPVVTITGWTYGFYNEETNSPSVTGGNPGSGEVTYTYYLDNACTVLTTNANSGAASNGEHPNHAGTYYVKATVAQTDNYELGTAVESFTISRQDVTPVFDPDHPETNNVAFIPSSVPNGIEPVVSMTDQVGNTISAQEYDVFINTKTHKVIISDALEEAGNYNITSATLRYPNEPGVAIVRVAPVAATLTYNGATQQLLETGRYGSAEHGTMAYALGTNSTDAPIGEYTTDVSAIVGTNAGDYYVWYKAVGDQVDYFDSIPVCLRVTIAKKTLTVSANPVSITYGEAPTNAGVTYTGFAEGDSADDGESVNTENLTFHYTYSLGGKVNAIGNATSRDYAIIPSGLTSSNYAIVYANGALTVNKKGVAIGITATNKVYDGTTNAVYQASFVGNDPIVAGDDLSIEKGTATFADGNVGSGKVVTFSDFTLKGNSAANYVLTGVTESATADITPKEVEVTVAVKDKVYDGTNAAEFDQDATVISGIVDGDDLAIIATGTYADVNVGEDKAVTITGVTLADGSNGLASNYSLTSFSPTESSAAIVKRPITITADGATKTYDGTALGKNTYTAAYTDDSSKSALGAEDVFESVTVAGSQVQAGTSPNVPSAAMIKNGSNVDVTSNYDITYANGSLTVTPKALTITADSDTKAYDGTPLTKDSYTNTDLAEGDTLQSVTVTGSQTAVGDGDNVPSGAVIKNSAEDDVTGSYEITYVNGNLSVTGKTITITAGSDTKAYDGTPLTKNSYTSTDLAAGDYIESVTVTGSQTSVGSGDNVPSGAVIKNASNEDVTDSYTIVYENGTLTVTQKNITITAKDASKEYDGTALTKNEYTTTDLLDGDYIESVTVTGSQIVAGSSNNVPSGAVIKNSSNEDVTSNYNITYTNGTLTVTKKALTITADDATKVYDGTVLTKTTYTNSDLAEGDTIESVTVSGGQIVAGSGNNVPSGAVIRNGNNDDVTASYDITYTNGTLTVTTKALTITADDDTKTYDGTPLTKNTFTSSGLATGDTITSVSCSGSQTVVGSSDNVPGAAVIKNGANEDVTASYDITYTNGTLTVTQKALTITADDASKVYDGTPLTKNTFTSSGLATGDTITSVSCAGSQTDVGSSSNVPSGAVIRNGANEDVTASYTISYANGTLTVNKRPVTITANNDTKVYDGTALTNGGCTGSGLLDGHSIASATVTGSQVAVGSSNNVPSDATIQNSAEVDVTGNYDISYANGTLTVTKRALTITAASATKYYDGTALTKNEYTSEGLAEGDSITSVTITGSQTQQGSSSNVPNDAVIQNSAQEDVTGNYEITYTNGTLDVTKKTVTITATSVSKVYDGTGLSANSYESTELLDGDYIESVTVTGSQLNVGSSSNVPSGAVIKNASHEDITENYEITYTNGTLEVTKKALTITADSTNKVYDGTELEIDSYSNTDLAAGDSIASVSINGSQTVVGSSSNVPGSAVIRNNANADVTSNYEITYVNGTLTVTKKNLTITAGSASKVYDGTALTKQDGYTVNGLVSGDSVKSVTINGSQTVYKSTPTSNVPSNPVIENANHENVTESYEITFVNGELSVTKRPVTITAGSATKVYDGTALTKKNGYSVEGLATGDSISSVNFATSQTLVGTCNNVPGNAKIKNSAGKDVSSSYAVTYASGTLTVTPKALTITAGSASKVYDGTALTKNTYTSQGLASGDSITSVTINGTRTIAGNTENKPSNPKIMRGTVDVTACYTIAFENGTLTILKRPLTITADSAEKIYDGTALTKKSYTNTPLLEGDTIASVTITGSQTQKGTSDNVPSAAVIKNSAGKAVTANYDITFVKGTLTIIGQARVLIAPKAATQKYNGRSQQLLSNAGMAEQGTMQYALGNDATTVPTTGWKTTAPTAVNAGTYYVWYKAVGNNDYIDSDAACVTATIKAAISYKVTFKVVNGSWSNNLKSDVVVTLNGHEGDTLKLTSSQIPGVGTRPNTGFKTGSWDVMPNSDTTITKDITYTYTYEAKLPISAKVTFKVVNGSWGDGTKADKTYTLSGYEGDNLCLSVNQIPSVGTKPDTTFKTGSWDVTPSIGGKITQDVTYTYTYAAKSPISAKVTFKVLNGSWNDGTTKDKVVTLNGYEGDLLRLTTDQIPAVGSKPGSIYKAGSWDSTPNTFNTISKDITYIYTYAPKKTISAKVTFKVVNGSWNDGTTDDVVVTLTGYEGDALKLSEKQIPSVGNKPSDTYKEGKWNTTLSTDTTITRDTIFIYTYAAKQAISYRVTFNVVNGYLDDGRTRNTVIMLKGLEGDTLKLSADQIPSAGTKPLANYKKGSWDVTPTKDMVISKDTTFTYTYAEKDKISATVTFKVVNGFWNDGTDTDRVVTLSGYEGDILKLLSFQIPGVGSRTKDHSFKVGSWDVVPDTTTQIKKNVTYTYTYAAKTPISAKVTYKVVNGTWDDGKSKDVVVTLKGYEGDTLRLSTDQIPAVGNKPAFAYKAGKWDVVPANGAIISEDTTFIYTFIPKKEVEWKVTFKVTNGTWNDGTAEDVIVTLKGYEGDALKLSKDQIPIAGDNPADRYKAGNWSSVPNEETAITRDMTYIYTYLARKSIAAKVTFKVVNGTWNDGTNKDVVVTLRGLEGDQLKLSEDQIPQVGNRPNDLFVAGSWDATPDLTLQPDENVVYTYTYAPKEAVKVNVRFKVENGTWNDGTKDDVVVTLEGYKGDEVKLTSDQIPASGLKPAEGFKPGSWDVLPYLTITLEKDLTFTYTYIDQKEIIPDDEGGVYITTEKMENNYGHAALDNTRAEIKKNVLDNEDLVQIYEGKDVNVWIEIKDRTEDVKQDEQELIEGKVKEVLGADYIVGCYLNVTLWKQVTGEFPQMVKEVPNGNVKISMIVPESLRKAGRTFKVARIHGGEAAILDAELEEATNRLTFESDAFSIYALVYYEPKSEKPKKSVTEIFSDIDPKSWYVGAVQYVYDDEIMFGKGDTIFAPNAVITREEVVQTLNNHMGKPVIEVENPFKDVVKGAWYYNAVLWGNKNEIAIGFGDGNFGIGKTITREQLAQMLYNYAKFNEYDLTLNKDAHKGYEDSKKVSDWATTAMDWAISQGIMSGKGVTGAPKSEIKLDPLAGATRAECASMIMKIDQKNKK